MTSGHTQLVHSHLAHLISLAAEDLGDMAVWDWISMHRGISLVSKPNTLLCGSYVQQLIMVGPCDSLEECTFVNAKDRFNSCDSIET